VALIHTGVGARRIDVSEEHKIFTSSIVFFEARDSKHTRRTASVGPGVALYDDDDAIDLTEDLPASPNAQDHTRPSHVRPSIGGGSSTQRTLSSGHHPYHHHSDYHYATRQPSLEDETPPYTPSPSVMGPTHSPGYTTPTHRRDDTAAEALEEFRQALRLDLENEHSRSKYASSCMSNLFIILYYLGVHGSFSPQPVASSSSSVHSFVEYSPRRHSIEDVPEEPATTAETQDPSRQQYFSPRTSRAVTPSPGTRTPESPSVSHPNEHARGRHHARFSLSNVLDSVKDRMRSSSPRITARDRTKSRDRAVGRDGHAAELEGRGRKTEKGKEKDRPQTPSTSRTTFSKIHDMLKLDDHEHHKDHGEGWQEFKKGMMSCFASCSM
jgi:arrestin-related trafficking adapter 3/6